jgi:hypothetical protein
VHTGRLRTRVSARLHEAGRLTAAACTSARHGNLRTAVHNRLHPDEPRRLMAHPVDRPESASIRRINRLVNTLGGGVNYLEIGVRSGSTFEGVLATARTGVEPHPAFDTQHLPDGVKMFIMTSDEFFASLDPGTRFDIVFVDGLHHYEQAYRDTINALRHLSPHGLLLLDDVVPSDGGSAVRDVDEAMRLQRAAGVRRPLWHGDVYRTVLALLDHPDLRIRTIVGSGNPQALIWNDRPDVVPTALSEGQLARYGSVSFDALFADGVPAEFRPGGEDAVLAEGLGSVVGR